MIFPQEANNFEHRLLARLLNILHHYCSLQQPALVLLLHAEGENSSQCGLGLPARDSGLWKKGRDLGTNGANGGVEQLCEIDLLKADLSRWSTPDC